MKKMILSVLVVLSLCVSCSGDNSNDSVETRTRTEIYEDTNYNRLILWVSQCVNDDQTYRNYIPLVKSHKDWYLRFENGDFDLELLMEIGRYYYLQDIYGDTTGEGDWQNEERFMRNYFGMDE